MIGIKDKDGRMYCLGCKKCKDVVKVELPYGFKLLQQELQAMNIVCKFDIAEDGKVSILPQ